ncbi:MAG: hypothetical protein U0Z44_07710 [Kouleothrix sp.]
MPAGVSRYYLPAPPFDGRSANMAKLWFEQVGVPLAAARQRADLLHVPYFAPPLGVGSAGGGQRARHHPLRLPEYRGGAAVRGAHPAGGTGGPARAPAPIAISRSTRAVT